MILQGSPHCQDKKEEVAQEKPRDSGENRKESRKREIIRIGEEGAWT